MRFWDASAVVPLICAQPQTACMQHLLTQDPAVYVWAWTPVECLSALMRLSRDGSLDAHGLTTARRRLTELRPAWSEVADLVAVRQRAERCLGVHPLRAADAGQLAAALLLVDKIGESVPFVTLDARLADAARAEAFVVLPLTESSASLI